MDDKDVDVTVDDSTFTINLGETYGATTSYVDGMDSGSVVYTAGDSDDTITLDLSDITIDGLVETDSFSSFSNWVVEQRTFENCLPNIHDVNKMCEHYPGLKKAYENFKTAYKLVEQDFEGKKKAGEIDDDDIPF